MGRKKVRESGKFEVYRRALNRQASEMSGQRLVIIITVYALSITI